jgi:hypothetical protein
MPAFISHISSPLRESVAWANGLTTDKECMAHSMGSLGRPVRRTESVSLASVEKFVLSFVQHSAPKAIGHTESGFARLTFQNEEGGVYRRTLQH